MSKVWKGLDEMFILGKPGVALGHRAECGDQASSRGGGGRLQYLSCECNSQQVNNVSINCSFIVSMSKYLERTRRDVHSWKRLLLSFLYIFILVPAVHPTRETLSDKVLLCTVELCDKDLRVLRYRVPGILVKNTV